MPELNKSGLKRFKMNNVHKKWFDAEEGLKDTIYSSRSSKIDVTQPVGRISRASLEESTQRALATHLEIPDGPIVIDKDLLQEIRDLIDEIDWLTISTFAEASKRAKALRDKLDSLYPYLTGLKEYQRTDLPLKPQEWAEGFGKTK